MAFKEKIQEAIRCLLHDGKVDVAQWMLEKFLEEFPDNAQAHHELAIIAHQKGDHYEAGRHFQKAVEHEPLNPLYLKWLGDFCHVVRKCPEEALSNYQKSLDLNPNDLDTLLTAAHLSVFLHRFSEAAKYFERAIEIDPFNEEAFNILSKLRSRQGMQKLVSMSPGDLYSLACEQVSRGQKHEAGETLEKILSIDENHALAHNDLGVLLFENGDIQAAGVHYEKAVEIESGNLTFLKNLGDFYHYSRGEYRKAMKQYVRALTLEPRDTETLISTGQLCMTLNRLDDARDFIKSALEIEPWNNDASCLWQLLEKNTLQYKGVSDHKQPYESIAENVVANFAEKTIQELEQLVSVDPENSLALNDLGVLYYDHNEKIKALSCYERAFHIAPENSNIIKNLADFYLMEEERTEDAMKLYIKVLENSPEDIECLMAIAYVCTLMRKPNDAKDFYYRILEIEPWNQDAWEALEKLENGVRLVTEGLPIKQVMGLR